MEYDKKTVYGRGNRPNKLKIQKQSEDNRIKIIKNLFNLKKENEAIKGRITGDIRTHFEQEDDYYKPIRVVNVWNNNYIEYKSNDDRSKKLSVKE